MALSLLLSSCVTNNGDIGRLYGIWTLTEMDVDGEPYSGWQTEDYPYSFFEFQNDICFVMRTNERYDYQIQPCTWKWAVEETRIDLNFTHTDDLSPEPGDWRYASPYWLLLTEPTVYTFDVEWVTDKEMIWTTINTRNQRLKYRLKKHY